MRSRDYTERGSTKERVWAEASPSRAQREEVKFWRPTWPRSGRFRAFRGRGQAPVVLGVLEVLEIERLRSSKSVPGTLLELLEIWALRPPVLEVGLG